MPLRNCNCYPLPSYRTYCVVVHVMYSDAEYAYRKVHGLRMDGRRWEIRWATRQDFK